MSVGVTYKSTVTVHKGAPFTVIRLHHVEADGCKKLRRNHVYNYRPLTQKNCVHESSVTVIVKRSYPDLYGSIATEVTAATDRNKTTVNYCRWDIVSDSVTSCYMLLMYNASIQYTISKSPVSCCIRADLE